MKEIAKDFGNGYVIYKLYANEFAGRPDYKYDTEKEAKKNHPESNILVGYRPYNVKDDYPPGNCAEWYDYLDEAIADCEYFIREQEAQPCREKAIRMLDDETACIGIQHQTSKNFRYE